jgi:LuxR family transcriptional regulator, maltose regulon positive regulatory protein
MQRQAERQVIWNERARSYDVRHFRPGIIGHLGMKPDTAEWFAWIEQIPSFRFQAKVGHFTARKETRARGGVYWIAYRHIGGQLVKKYIGPQVQVTIARLEEIAGDLERRTRPEA